MSVDVEKITEGFQLLQDFWANVVTILIACTMLWFKAGYVMFASLLVIVALISTTSMSFTVLLISTPLILLVGKISRFVGAAQNAWLTATDARIRLLASWRRFFSGDSLIAS